MTKEEFRKNFRDALWDKSFTVWDLSNQDTDDIADLALTQTALLLDASPWQPIETAPKDGSAVLLLSAAYEDAQTGSHPAKVAIGHWYAEGTSWVDEHGLLGGDSYTLAITGAWFSGGGWFQPNEVTHWMPIPKAPDAPAEEKGEGE
jgi:hypothetical protein